MLDIYSAIGGQDIGGISDLGNREFLKNDDFLRKIGGVLKVNPCF